MANFLDLTTGMPALWAKIKSKFYTKAEVDALIPEDEVMVVNITEDNGEYSSDKTCAEIYNHVNSGGIAYAVYNDNYFTMKECAGSGTNYYTEFTVAQNIYSEDDNATFVSGAVINMHETNGNVEINISIGVNIAIPEGSKSSDGLPVMDGTATRGRSSNYARADHVHPTDTSRAAVADVLTKTNTTSYTPTADYNPATKKYVDDTVAAAAPSCATTAEIEEMCDALGFYSVTIDTSDYEERSNSV